VVGGRAVTGQSKRVFVELGDGLFESREVETGWVRNDRIQITKGLREGERVVSAGTFLVDSESRLQLASTAPITSSGSSSTQ
jgi:membrane fusion protein, copper/silver efflux system